MKRASVRRLTSHLVEVLIPICWLLYGLSQLSRRSISENALNIGFVAFNESSIDVFR